MSYSFINEGELRNRVSAFQQILLDKQLDGALLMDKINIYYYSGTMQNSIMYIPASGEAVLFVKKSLERAKLETVFNAEKMPSMKLLSEELSKRNYRYDRIGMEFDVLPFQQFQRIQKAFPTTVIEDVSQLIRLQRSVKSNIEIEQIRESAKVVNEAFAAIPNILKKGMSEIEFVAELEKIVRVRGHIGQLRMRAFNQELFLGMVVSGESAAIPTAFDGPAGGEGLSPAMPQGAGWKLIAENEPILIDMTVAVNGYVVDQTRMAVIGQLDEELENAYNVSMKILKETEKNAKPGTLWSEHYLHAVEMAKEAGLGDYFMGFKSDQAKFLGHGVGLEVDELPVLAKGLDKPLQVGMVLAVEPKFTYPNIGVIGIENTYVVTEKGLEALSYTSEEIIKLSVNK